MSMTDGRGADDVVVCVPSADIMAEAAAMMSVDGMLILFAGVPNGTLAPLNLSNVFLHNAQYTGTSGLTIRDQELVMRSTEAKSLSPGRSVAAIGGMSAARDGIEALMQGRYAGKIVIFPQISELPLTGLDELKTRLPRVAAKLGPDYLWTTDAEAELIEIGWQPPGVSAK
jgi:threonine dehydrogenase-like Zn-dependent dehydrogenase